MAVLGIDVGGSSVKLAVLTPGVEPVTSTSDAYADPDSTALALAIGQALERAGRPDARSVCVCMPGRVSSTTGVLQAAANLSALVGTPIATLVRDVAGADRVTVDTDARAAAHHVWRERDLAGRLLAISIGTGVGACVLDDGEPLRLTGTSSGHLGQIDVSLGIDAPVGPDGARGSLEAYVGTAGLRRAGVDVAADTISLRPDGEPLVALSRAIRIAHAIYRPDHVLLLGGTGIRLRPSLDELRARVEFQLTGVASAAWTLDTGWTPFHAALGAAMLASEPRS